MARTAAVIGLVLGLALGIGIGLVWADDGPGSTSAATSVRAGEESLYALEAHQGWVTGDGDRAWTLHLRGSRVLWFADRPARESGTMTVEELVTMWPGVFGDSPPNGAIAAPDAPEGDRPTALVIGRPELHDGILTFPIKADVGMSEASVAWLSDMTADRSEDYGGISFFIDSTLNPTRSFKVKTNVVNLVWNPGASQCAGYGTASFSGIQVMQLSYVAFFSGKCWFESTVAFFDVIGSGGVHLGHVTWTGGGELDECDGDSLTCEGASLGGLNDWQIVSNLYPAP